MDYITLTIDGVEYAAIPMDEYRKLKPAGGDDVDWARSRIGDSLRKAREHAQLSQVELAQKLDKSQTLVSRAEAGAISVSEKYVTNVLKACGLPKNWTGEDVSAELPDDANANARLLAPAKRSPARTKEAKFVYSKWPAKKKSARRKSA